MEVISTQEIEERTESLKEVTAQFRITDQESYIIACGHLGELKGLLKRAHDDLDPVVNSTNIAHKNACTLRNKICNPIETMIEIVGGAISKWNLAQEAKRKAQELELQRIAAQQEETRRLNEAAALEAAGQHDEAAEVLETPAPVPSVILPPAVPKVQGVSFRDDWFATVTDLKKLVKSVAAGKVPITAIQPNQTFLNQQARALKSLMKYPGVTANYRKITAVKS